MGKRPRDRHKQPRGEIENERARRTKITELATIWGGSEGHDYGVLGLLRWTGLNAWERPLQTELFLLHPQTWVLVHSFALPRPAGPRPFSMAYILLKTQEWLAARYPYWNRTGAGLRCSQ